MFPSVTVCNLNQVEAQFLMHHNAYGDVERTNLLVKEFTTGHQDNHSKEIQEYLDEVKREMDMESGWTFIKRSRQLCKDLFLFTIFRGMNLTWSQIPWEEIPDWENQGWHLGPMYYPTDFGACCHLAPHLDLNKSSSEGNKTIYQMYHDLKADAMNGASNGLKIVLNAEQFNYGLQTP